MTTDLPDSPVLDAMRPSHVRELLERLQVRPRKALGQNFLIDRNILGHLLDIAGVQSTDTVLEIGPGLGAVTTALLGRAGRVVAVEADPRLAGYLRERFAGVANLQLLTRDMLDLSLDEMKWLDGTPLVVDRVVSNLPYSAGTRILIDLSRARGAPGHVVVTLQKEVADRMAAKPRTADYGMLSVWMQAVYEIETVRTIGPRCFYPEPEIDSVIVRMARRPNTALPPAAFYSLSKRAFGHRRKQMVGTLATDTRPAAAIRDALRAVGAPEDARPEVLSSEQWLQLTVLLTGEQVTNPSL